MTLTTGRSTVGRESTDSKQKCIKRRVSPWPVTCSGGSNGPQLLGRPSGKRSVTRSRLSDSVLTERAFELTSGAMTKLANSMKKCAVLSMALPPVGT